MFLPNGVSPIEVLLFLLLSLFVDHLFPLFEVYLVNVEVLKVV